MADFLKAIPIILEHEGGYANVDGDKGGETYRGITRKNFPNWQGWQLVDSAKPLEHGAIIPNKALDALVNTFYKYQFWDKLIADKISSQKIATFMFDWFVNSGYHAVTGIQIVLKVRADGVMGQQTMAAINRANEDEVYPLLLQQRRIFVKNICIKSPSQEKFLEGWMNRINSFA